LSSSLTYCMEEIIFHKEKDANISNKKLSTSLGRKLQIKSTLVHLFAEHEQMD
jgi:hypothetical protein